jgi:hypothetical protein
LGHAIGRVDARSFLLGDLAAPIPAGSSREDGSRASRSPRFAQFEQEVYEWMSGSRQRIAIVFVFTITNVRDAVDQGARIIG